MKQSFVFSGRFSPFISCRIAITFLYRMHSFSLGNRAMLLKPQAWPLSARALTLKSDWVGSDVTVASRLELLANHWTENTIGIVFQIRLHQVRALQTPSTPASYKMWQKDYSPHMEGVKNNFEIYDWTDIFGLWKMLSLLNCCWPNCVLKSIIIFLSQIKRRRSRSRLTEEKVPFYLFIYLFIHHDIQT